MKPHPRIRKTIKWGGAVVTVLLVAVWVGSGWWYVKWNDGDGGAVILGAGGVHIFTIDPSSEACRPRGWDTGYHDLDFSSVDLESMPSFAGYRGISIGALVAVTLPLVAAAWLCETLARRRARLNLCPKCGYDRTGLASKDAKCPECGSGKEPL